jgi:maltose alpha-D-glucosyltransferase/alpha-amylase
LLDNDPRRIRLAYAILLSFVGSPVLYYGDEIGMGDNIWLDDRDGVRTPMQWNGTSNSGFSPATADKLAVPVISDGVYGYPNINVAKQMQDPDSLLNWLSIMLRVRKQHPVFGQGSLIQIPAANLAVLVYIRTDSLESVCILNNLSSQPQKVDIDFSNWLGFRLRDIITNQEIKSSVSQHTSFDLNGYDTFWLKLEKR